MVSGKRQKDDKPCDHYSGNLCSGFGGEKICFTCGWDKYLHGERGKKLLEKLKEAGLTP